MPTAIPKTMMDVANTYLESEVVFNALTACMALQPELDPDAGYEVFQIPTMFLSLGMNTVKQQMVIERLDYSPIKLYVLMRSYYMGGLSTDEFESFIIGEIKLDLRVHYRRLLKFVPRFKKRGVLSQLV